MFPVRLSRLTLSTVFLLLPLACGPNTATTPDVISRSRPTSAIGQGIIRGQITASGLNFSTAQTSGMGGVEVYLDGLPDIRTKSSPDGSFELTGVPDGEHFVVAETSTAEGNFKVRQAATVSASTPVADVRSLVLKRTGSISGLVTVADGSGNLLGTDVFIAGSTLVAKAKDNGAYALTNVAEGTYKVTALRQGFAPVTQEVQVNAGRPSQLNLTLTERESSASQNSVSGTVQTQTPNGLQPLAGVVVSLRGGTSTLSDADGKYVLASVPAGEHTVQLYKAGYRLHTLTQTIAANSGDTPLPATILEIESNRALITGTVTDAENTPLEGIKVELGSRFVYTDAEGQYRFEDVNSGGNTLRFSKGQKGVTPCGNGALFEPVSQDVVAETGKTSQVNATLTEACEVTIAGRIQDFGDTPLAAELFVEELNRNLSVHPTQGTFRSEPLKSGAYTLVIRKDGYESLTFKANLTQSVDGIVVQLWPRLAGSSDSDGDKILNADEKPGQKLDPTNDSIFPPVYPLEAGGDIDGDGIQNQTDKTPFDPTNDSVEYMGSKIVWPNSSNTPTDPAPGPTPSPVSSPGTPTPTPAPSTVPPVSPPSGVPSDYRNPLDMNFKYIAPGTYIRGQKGISEPAHQVTLTRGYYIQTTEVTQKQWWDVMGAWPGAAPSAGRGIGNNHSIYNVTWNDVQDFITALNAKGHGTYRLPTEAEWEYAARAGTTTTYACPPDSGIDGNSIDCLKAMGWYNGNNIGHGFPSGSKPVAQKLANAWGLYDMHGNSWEWVQDFYGPYSAENQTDPTGPDTGSQRVYRGGYWLDQDHAARSATRGGISPTYRYDIGFRLVREP